MYNINNKLKENTLDITQISEIDQILNTAIYYVTIFFLILYLHFVINILSSCQTIPRLAYYFIIIVIIQQINSIVNLTLDVFFIVIIKYNYYNRKSLFVYCATYDVYNIYHVGRCGVIVKVPWRLLTHWLIPRWCHLITLAVKHQNILLF